MESTVNPVGELSWALVAAPLSPANPGAGCPDDVVLRVGDVHIFQRVHSHTFRPAQRRTCGRHTVATEAGRPVAREGVNDPARIHHADDVVLGVGDVYVAS